MPRRWCRKRRRNSSPRRNDCGGCSRRTRRTSPVLFGEPLQKEQGVAGVAVEQHSTGITSRHRHLRRATADHVHLRGGLFYCLQHHPPRPSPATRSPCVDCSTNTLSRPSPATPAGTCSRHHCSTNTPSRPSPATRSRSRTVRGKKKPMPKRWCRKRRRNSSPSRND